MAATLLAGILTLLLPAGLALIATGLGRAKNAAHAMIGHLLVCAIAIVTFFLFGFAIAGADPSQTIKSGWTFAHFHGFLLFGVRTEPRTLTWFVIAAISASIASMIPLGAMVERLSLKAHIGFGVGIGGVLYPLAACWLWTGGWLQALGSHFRSLASAVDFSGAAAVHLLGGTIGLLATIMLRPRLGKFDREGTPRPILGHDVPMVMLGTMLVLFAWFGFATSRSFLSDDGKAPLVAVNTLLAGIGGAIGAASYMWLRFGRPDPSLTCNGLLAGLVAISAGTPWVAPGAALAIGIVGGVAAIIGVLFIERRGIDDPVGVASTHGLAGAWGMLSVGLLADGTGSVTGLFYGGGFAQLLVQFIAVVAVVLLALIGGVVLFAIIKRTTVDARVAAEIEFAGLDIPETGAPGYPEFVARTGPESFGGGVMQ